MSFARPRFLITVNDFRLVYFWDRVNEDLSTMNGIVKALSTGTE